MINVTFAALKILIVTNDPYTYFVAKWLAHIEPFLINSMIVCTVLSEELIYSVSMLLRRQVRETV